MYNAIYDSLIIGKKVIYLPSCHSTNDIAAELVRKDLMEEGTVVITDNQTQGRGQRGTAWLSEPGKNLTLSFILRPVFLPIQRQFLLSQTIALALSDFLSKYSSEVRIKWPNDIYVSGKKISGTSIENSIQGTTIASTVIGIGVNINQVDFTSPRMTSLAAMLGEEIALIVAFEELMQLLDKRYHSLKSMVENQVIHLEYLTHLIGYQESVKFVRQGNRFQGTVIGIAESGRILIKPDGADLVQDFGIKEIEWIFDE